MTPIQTIIRGLTFCLALALGATAALAVGTVDVKQSAALQSQGALLIDVRTPGEFAQGHAPGATLIPLVIGLAVAPARSPVRQWPGRWSQRALAHPLTHRRWERFAGR